MRSPDRLPRPLFLIIAACAVIETGLTLSGLPPFSNTTPRNLAAMFGAFWPGLLSGWDPLYPGQGAVMFFSYAFVHGGFLHMLFNMLILAHLGRETIARVGSAGFVLFFALTSAGGGVAYALLATGSNPMLGASGAVFGLFGAQAWWDLQIRRARGLPLQPVVRMMLGLVVMNVLLWVLVGGMLAWQAHLGGFVAGFALAWIVTPTTAHRWRGGVR